MFYKKLKLIKDQNFEKKIVKDGEDGEKWLNKYD